MNVMEWNNPHALYWPSVSCVHGQMFPLPLEILEEIFLNLPRNQVVLTCRLVCSRWKVVADSESLWKERCRREGLHLRDGSRIPEDWRLFYFLCKKRRNLIKNPKGDRKNLPSLLFRHVWLPVDQELNFFSSKLFHIPTGKMEDWVIQENGGDGWKLEKPMAPHPNKTVLKNFVTSYG